MKKQELANGLALSHFSLGYHYFVFIDTPDYLADGLFVKHEVPVHFLKEYAKEGSPYLIIFCKCRKRDTSKFLTALKELPDKMLLCGYTDYIEFCKMFIESISRKARAL